MVIAVAGGKGGTGKTLVALNLALALHRQGRKVRLLDADVEEPDVHLFLDPAWEGSEEVGIPVPAVDPGACDLCGDCARVCAYGALAVTRKKVMVFEELCHGCGGCSLACPQGAIGEKSRRIGMIEWGYAPGSLWTARGLLDIGEPKASPVISRLKGLIDPEAVNVMDCGPGTGCPTITALRGADVCLMVTEPTPFGLHDLGMAVDMAEALEVRSLVVMNKDVPGEDAVRTFCRDKGLEVVLSIPFSLDIARLCSRGANLVDEDDCWTRRFLQAWQRVCELVPEVTA